VAVFVRIFYEKSVSDVNSWRSITPNSRGGGLRRSQEFYLAGYPSGSATVTRLQSYEVAGRYAATEDSPARHYSFEQPRRALPVEGT
jgi:hypothetical protein